MSSIYSVTMTPAIERKLRELLTAVRESQARLVEIDHRLRGDAKIDFDDEWNKLGKEFGSLRDGLRALVRALPQGDDQFDLHNDISTAYQRWVEPFELPQPKGFKFNPSKFGDLVEELLDPAKLVARHRLFGDALVAGFGAAGHLNDVIKKRTSEMINRDMDDDR